MPKPLKYTLIIVGGILLLLVLLVAGVILFVDPNDYRGQIEQAASDKLGRQVEINGPMSLSFFPWIGLEVQDMQLANAQGFKPQTMLSVQKAGLKVKFLPLLSQKLQVGTLFLDQGELHLAKNAQGKTNWQDLVPASQNKTSTTSDTGQEQQSPAGMAALSIEKIRISDTLLTWTDAKADMRTQVQDLSFEVGPVSLDKPFPFDLSCRVDNAQPQVRADLSCTGRAQVDMAEQVVHLQDVDLQSTTRAETLPTGSAETRVQTSMTLNLATGDLDLPQITLTTYDITLKGQAQGQSLFTAPKISGRLNLQELNPQKVISTLELPRIRTKDPKALNSLQASTQFTATPSAVQLSSLKLLLDQTTLQGNIDLDLKPALPACTFDLKADTLNVDRYLPPQAAADRDTPSKKPEQDQTAQTKSATAGLPVGMLRQLNLNGQLNVQQMTVKGMQMEDITLKVQSQDGQLTMSPLQAGLYGGGFQSKTVIDLRQQTPSLRLDANLDSVQMQSLLSALTGKQVLSGMGSVQTTLHSQGLDAASLLKTLDGQLHLELRDGSLQGTNLLHLIRSTWRTLQGGQPAQGDQKQATQFSTLNFDADISQGVVQKSELRLSSPLLQVRGSGQLDLVAKSLDYQLKVKVAQDLSQEYSDLSDLEGMQVPVDVQGSLTDPRYTINAQTLLQVLGQEQLPEEIDQGLRKLQEKLGMQPSKNKTSTEQGGQGEAVQKLLEGFFGSQPSDSN